MPLSCRLINNKLGLHRKDASSFRRIACRCLEFHHQGKSFLLTASEINAASSAVIEVDIAHFKVWLSNQGDEPAEVVDVTLLWLAMGYEGQVLDYMLKIQHINLDVCLMC
jgi:hypothetical protein